MSETMSEEVPSLSLHIILLSFSIAIPFLKKINHIKNRKNIILLAPKQLPCQLHHLSFPEL